MEFTVSNDKMARVVTAFVTVLFIGLATLPFFTVADADSAGRWIMFGTTGLAWVIYLFAWLLRPTGYSITGDRLIIRRPWRSRDVSFGAITDIRMPEPSAMRWSIRLFGSGGLFGYFGRFRNKTFGNMNWYATRLDKFTVINLRSGETIVLTPDDATFATRLGSAAGLDQHR